MRGQVDAQSGLFSYFSVEERIAADHSLRGMKAQVDAVLGAMSPQFDAMYATVGRPSIAPERLLKATLLIALYSVRSDRLFCEMKGQRSAGETELRATRADGKPQRSSGRCGDHRCDAL